MTSVPNPRNNVVKLSLQMYIHIHQVMQDVYYQQYDLPTASQSFSLVRCAMRAASWGVLVKVAKEARGPFKGMKTLPDLDGPKVCNILAQSHRP